jgi:transcriptional regulator with XRE-family HTH domain
MSYFSTNLKKIRQIHNLSQSAFAELLNLNRGVISSYEEQRAQPKIETVLRIAEHFNLSSDELLSAPLTVNRLTKFELENSKEPLKLDPPIEKQISFQQWSRNNGSEPFDSSQLKELHRFGLYC